MISVTVLSRVIKIITETLGYTVIPWICKTPVISMNVYKIS